MDTTPNYDDSWHEGGLHSPEWAAKRRHDPLVPKPEPPPYEHQEYPKVVRHAEGHHVTVYSEDEEKALAKQPEEPTELELQHPPLSDAPSPSYPEPPSDFEPQAVPVNPATQAPITESTNPETAIITGEHIE